MKVDKKISSRRSNWKFDKKVVSNFETHVKQSVPFYQISHDLTKKLSDFFLKENSNCYDLGCSTGNLLKEEVLAKDVGKAFLALAKAKKTTGDIMTVDGGNIPAALR